MFKINRKVFRPTAYDQGVIENTSSCDVSSSMKSDVQATYVSFVRLGDVTYAVGGVILKTLR